MKKYASILIAFLCAGSLSAAATMNATAIKFKIYKLAFSNSTACTNPITVFDNAAGVQADMLNIPTFGSGTIKKGTYECVMIEMSKVINIAGSATCSTAWDDLICNSGSSQQSKLIDGTPVTCSGTAANDQRVVLYITTVSAGTSGNRALLPPLSTSDTTSGLKLTDKVVISAAMQKSLTINKLMIDGSNCTTVAPTFGIK